MSLDTLQGCKACDFLGGLTCKRCVNRAVSRIPGLFLLWIPLPECSSLGCESTTRLAWLGCGLTGAATRDAQERCPPT